MEITQKCFWLSAVICLTIVSIQVRQGRNSDLATPVKLRFRANCDNDVSPQNNLKITSENNDLDFQSVGKESELLEKSVDSPFCDDLYSAFKKFGPNTSIC